MPDKLRIAVFASGGGTNLQSIVDRCEDGRIDGVVVLVISDKAEAGALERARKHGASALHFDVPKTGTDEWVSVDAQITEALQEAGVELICLAGYMRMIGPHMLAAFPGRIMNIHPALLPAFKGTHGQRDALDYGAKVAGATVHFADAEFDHGPIIVQSAVPICEDDTEETLGARILRTEHEIYARAIQWFAEGRLRADGRRVHVEGEVAAGFISPDTD